MRAALPIPGCVIAPWEADADVIAQNILKPSSRNTQPLARSFECSNVVFEKDCKCQGKTKWQKLLCTDPGSPHARDHGCISSSAAPHAYAHQAEQTPSDEWIQTCRRLCRSHTLQALRASSTPSANASCSSWAVQAVHISSSSTSTQPSSRPKQQTQVGFQTSLWGSPG